MRLGILIATTGRGHDPVVKRRVRAAYLRETPLRIDAQFVVTSGPDLRTAWQRGLAIVSDQMDWIHFGADTLEPHPGWTKAAVAGGGKVVAPVLWSSDGEPQGETRDWARVGACEFPTVHRSQLEKLGLPPYTDADCVVRSNYAFTVLD
jgi:hypothetical protein